MQERLGHAQRRGVDQAAVQRDGAATLARGLRHRRDDPAGLLRRRRVGREHLVGQGDLGRVDRPLALVAQHRGAARGGAVPLGIAEVAVRAVDRAQTVGPAGDRDAREGVVPLVAPVPRAVIRPHRVGVGRAADRGRVALQRGRVVGDAEHHRLHPLRARGGDLVHAVHAGRRLDQHADPDPVRQRLGGLDLVEQGRDEVHVAGTGDLGDQDGVDVRAGLLDHVDDVAVAPVGVEPVDAQRHGGGGPVAVAQHGDDLLPRALLVIGRDGVLEVEHDDVGAEPGRLLEHAEVAAWNGQLGAMEACRRDRHGRGSVEPRRLGAQADIESSRWMTGNS